MIEPAGAEVVLDALLGTGDPSEYEVALSSLDPDDGWSEINHASYDRVTVGNSSSDWSDVSDQEKMNETEVQFPAATGDWGHVRGVGLYDPISGERVLRGRVVPPRRVRNGDMPRFSVGTMVVRVR